MEVLLQSNKTVVVFLRRTAMVGSIITVLFGLLGLLFWEINISVLSAAAFVSAGAALLSLLPYHNEPPKPLISILALILSIITFLIGLIIAIHLTTGLNGGLSQFLFAYKLTGNQISLDTGINFFLIGTALIFLQFYYKKYFTRIAQTLTLLAAITSMFAVIGYAYKALSFYGAAFAPMPLSSALIFSTLCLSILFARSNHGLTKILTRNIPSSKMALRLITISLTLPAIIGSLCLLGKELNLFDIQTAISLIAIGNILLFSIIIWVNTRSIQNLELENLIIKTELQKKNIQLEIDAKQLASKALELEGEKKEAYDKLSQRDKLFEVLQSQDKD